MEPNWRRILPHLDLISFTEALGYVNAPFHEEIYTALQNESIKRLILILPPGHGKALALDTPVPTPSGWKQFGALEIGDELFDENGHVCHVIATTETWTGRPCYEVTTDDGDVIVADELHEWPVLLDRHRNRICRESIHETGFLAKKRTKRPLSRFPKPLHLPAADLLIPPYVLGVWLGDGNSDGGRITSGDKDRTIIRENIEACGCKTTNHAERENFGIPGLRTQLVALGVRNNKHVPTIYLRASIPQRLALLQGLIDTDGHVAPDGQIEFCSTNFNLASGVQELVRSLGCKCSLTEGRARLYGRDVGPKYRVSFYLRDAARLPRKATLCRNATRTPNRYLTVRRHPSVAVRCIQVSSPRGLFLVGRGFVPTHNSTCVTVNYPLWRVGRDHNFRVIEASHTKDFVASFIREITQRMASTDYQKVFGDLKPQKPNKWTQNELIVNRTQIHKDPTFTALGTGQAIIGRRAHEIILDDIVDEDYASSEVLRESVWSWYKNEVLTRLEPGGRVIVVGTRVHFADFYGRLLEEKAEDGKPLWHVILLPAIDENNQALWPTKWPLERLLAIKQELGSPVFTRKYLGQPTPQEGAELQAKWLNYYHPQQEDIPNRVYKLPSRERLRVVQAWDLAISEAPTAAYTVGITLGSDMEGGLYVLRYVREHWDYPTTSKMIEAEALAWKPEKIGIEAVQYQRMVSQGLRPKLLPIIDIKQSKAKDERIRSMSPHFENGTIRIDRSMDELIMEYLQFPKGTKDILDALEMAVRLVMVHPVELDKLGSWKI